MNVGDSERTIDLTPGATEGVLFDGMTADGSKVFFSSEEHLTGEDEHHTGADIFMWSQKGEEEGQPLTLISTGTEGDADSCDPVANTAHEHWNTTGAAGKLRRRRDRRRRRGRLRRRHHLLPLPEHARRHRRTHDGVKNAPNLYVARPGAAPHFVATLESSLTGPQPPKRATPSSAPSAHSPNRNLSPSITPAVHPTETYTSTTPSPTRSISTTPPTN